MLKLDRTGATPQLYLYGLVSKPSWWTDDDVISSESVEALLSQLDPGDELIVRINSEGGDVFDGFAIYNALARRKARVEVQIDALAASIASVIAMAGDEIVIAGNATVMIHRAWTWAAGDAEDLHKVAEALATVDENILNTYEARVGKKSTREQIAQWVAAETWMGPDEAVARGFADRASDLKTAASAAVRPGRFKNTPAYLLTAAKPAPAAEGPPASRRPSSLPAIAARIAAARTRASLRNSA